MSVEKLWEEKIHIDNPKKRKEKENLKTIKSQEELSQERHRKKRKKTREGNTNRALSKM